MELFRALGVLAEPPLLRNETVSRALGLPGRPTKVEYTELFQFNLYPYASVYLGEDGMLGGESRDRVAGFWRALELVPPAEPDHLTALLGLYASVAEEEMPGEVRRALLWEHLLAWLPPYLEKTRELAPPFYRQWAELLSAGLVEEAARLPAGGLVPLHLRGAAPLADPREEGLEPFLASVLAPVRSGLLLVRADFARAARELRLGLRLGERRFILRALLAQDAPGSLRWLAREAEAWIDRHRRQAPGLEPVTDFWAARAERSAELLAELAVTTEREVVGV